MTVAGFDGAVGALRQVAVEEPAEDEDYRVDFSEKLGPIQADLTIGANVAAAVELRANSGVSCPGVKLHGSGFIVTPEEAAALGLGTTPGLEKHIRKYRNGRDLTDRPRGVMVIDLFGLTIEQVREQYPAVFQWVWERVKPEREQNNRGSYRDSWWVFGEPRRQFRPALAGLSRYIATVETSKHRFFVFLDAEILPDNMLVNVATEDACVLGVLSSRIHVCWALATGGTLEDRPRYNKTRCFETFPFPACTDEQKRRIRDLGEQLDAHRKRQQAAHPELTLTGMYNVLVKLRKGEPLTAKDKAIHEAGLVGVLKQIHDELDAAVAQSFGWPVDLSGEGILERLVALNAERAAEEARGLVRWLRPEYQNPQGAAALAGLESGGAQAGESETEAIATTPKAPKGKLPWPASLPGQFQALREALARQPAPVDPPCLAREFQKAKAERVAEMLDTLVVLGHARRFPDGRFVA